LDVRVNKAVHEVGSLVPIHLRTMVQPLPDLFSNLSRISKRMLYKVRLTFNENMFELPVE